MQGKNRKKVVVPFHPCPYEGSAFSLYVPSAIYLFIHSFGSQHEDPPSEA